MSIFPVFMALELLLPRLPPPGGLPLRGHQAQEGKALSTDAIKGRGEGGTEQQGGSVAVGGGLAAVTGEREGLACATLSAREPTKWQVWRAIGPVWHARWSGEMAVVVLTGVYSAAMAQLFARIIATLLQVREHLPVDLSKVPLEAVASYHRDARRTPWWSWRPRIRSDGTTCTHL